MKLKINMEYYFVICWLIGYFCICCPLIYSLNGTLIEGLIHAIIGLLIADLILLFS